MINAKCSKCGIWRPLLSKTRLCIYCSGGKIVPRKNKAKGLCGVQALNKQTGIKWEDENGRLATRNQEFVLQAVFE
jgi:hypothetical protein